MYIPGLTNPVAAILRLRVHGWVPVAVVEDDGICTSQIDAYPARPSRQDHSEHTPIRIEPIHQRLKYNRKIIDNLNLVNCDHNNRSGPMLYIISYIPYNMQWGPNGIIRTNGMPLIYQKSGIRINISISMRLILILASGNTRIIPKIRWIFSAHSLNIYTKLIFSVKSCGRKKNILLYIQCSLRCCRRYQRDNSSGDGFLSDYSTDMYHGISTILGWQSTYIRLFMAEYFRKLDI